jgi:hypothetical protein
MPVETPSLFAKVIQDHLELKQRNADLEPQMPLRRYKADDPFENHPLFKTEEQARLEETMDGEERLPEPAALAWPGDETGEHVAVEPGSPTSPLLYGGRAGPGGSEPAGRGLVLTVLLPLWLRRDEPAFAFWRFWFRRLGQ